MRLCFHRINNVILFLFSYYYTHRIRTCSLLVGQNPSTTLTVLENVMVVVGGNKHVSENLASKQIITIRSVLRNRLTNTNQH